MSKYTLHFKYQAVLHYLHIRSQQRTADHYGISRTHLRRWIRAYQEGGIGALEHPQSKTMPQHRKNPFITDKPDYEKHRPETFVKKPFPQQPKPKNRFSSISLPQYLLILPKYPLNPPRTPHNQVSGPPFRRQQAHLAC